MALSFNNSPYFDDFSESKGFLKLLFTPGYAVQARKLTQSQDILQNQISRFGSFVFQSGSPVLGAKLHSTQMLPLVILILSIKVHLLMFYNLPIISLRM